MLSVIKHVVFLLCHVLLNVIMLSVPIEGSSRRASIEVGTNAYDYSCLRSVLRPIYMWVWFRIRLAHFPKYKNNYIL